MSTPIVVEQTFEVPPDLIWQAITDPEQMRRWFFEQMNDFSAEVGFETQFNVHHEGRDYLHLWKVTEVEPQKRLVYDWRYGGHDADSFVTWELQETASGCSLTLTHTGSENFPQDDPAFTRTACSGGWNYFVAERLPAFIQSLG